MDPDEIIKKIEQAYNTATTQLAALDNEKRQIIAQYIKNLEAKKIEEIKKELQSLLVSQDEN
ncbi:MAG: hypothetical protein KBD57_01790 [Bacteroidia bacterium]|jgi:protein subunit release factor A|nr:hypothetical protein [Bacteroidia bacterium]